MLSLKNVSAAQAMSYYKKDDYYTRTGGEWQGQLKTELKLPDEITKKDFNFFMKQKKERAGFDLCFSAPKSVSIAMSQDKETLFDMTEAHNKAVQKTLDYIEKTAIYSRVTNNHVTQREFTGNMLCGKFNHFVSRNQDPQMHTHCVVINQTLCTDGKIRAIDNPDLFRNKMLFGQIYRNELANELQSKGYAINITSKGKGFFELQGINREQIETFSTRRKEIVEKLKEWDKNSAQSAEKAALLTREAKKNKDLDVLIKSWKETAKEHDIKFTRMEKIIIAKKNLYEIYLETEKKLSSQTFAFEKRELLGLALKNGMENGASLENAEKFFNDRLNKDILYLGDKNGVQYYCTKESRRIEKNILETVAKGKNSMQGISTNYIQNYIQNKDLSDEQKKAVLHVCSNRDRFTAVQGLAGTGKTHMLRQAKEVFENQGYEVKGVCFTGKAGEELSKGAGIESKTLHSHLNNLEKEAGNFDIKQDLEKKESWDLKGLKKDNKQVWIVDEASMVDNKMMYQIMDAAERKNAKIVFVGDSKQLQPVGSGNSFTILVENKKIDYVEMTDIRRQKDKNLKEAVYESVRGDIKKSLAKLDNHTLEIKDHSKRIKVIAKDFAGQTKQNRENSVIVTGSNRDRQDLNQKVRQILKENKMLQEGINHSVLNRQGKTSIKEFSPNDKIMFLKNDTKLSVKNGQTGYVQSVNPESMIVKSGTKEYLIKLNEYKHIDYGYALTTHKAQGITENQAFLHIDSKQKSLNSRNAYYVDISRARHSVKIYTDDKKELKQSVSKFQEKLSSKDFTNNKIEIDKPEKVLDWNKFKQKFQHQHEEPKKRLDWNEFKDKFSNIFNKDRSRGIDH